VPSPTLAHRRYGCDRLGAEMGLGSGGRELGVLVATCPAGHGFVRCVCMGAEQLPTYVSCIAWSGGEEPVVVMLCWAWFLWVGNLSLGWWASSSESSGMECGPVYGRGS
jgi:hypothetical protein